MIPNAKILCTTAALPLNGVDTSNGVDVNLQISVGKQGNVDIVACHKMLNSQRKMSVKFKLNDLILAFSKISHFRTPHKTDKDGATGYKFTGSDGEASLRLGNVTLTIH